MSTVQPLPRASVIVLPVELLEDPRLDPVLVVDDEPVVEREPEPAVVPVVVLLGAPSAEIISVSARAQASASNVTPGEEMPRAAIFRSVICNSETCSSETCSTRLAQRGPGAGPNTRDERVNRSQGEQGGVRAERNRGGENGPTGRIPDQGGQGRLQQERM